MIGNGVTRYSAGTFDKGFLKDSVTLNNLKKLAEVLGGKFNGGKIIGTEFDFGGNTHNAEIFAKAATLFTGNEHLPYFGRTVKNNSENQTGRKHGDFKLD